MKNSKMRSLWQALAVLFSFIYCPIVIAQTWEYVPAIEAQDISVGKGGVVWATTKDNSIVRFNGMNWQTIDGKGSRIAVDPEGSAWLIGTGGIIYKYKMMERTWEIKQGSATDIAVGADGSVWIVGANAVSGGYDIYKWNGSSWGKITGGAIRIAVDQKGNAWIVNNNNNVYSYDGSAFVLRPGAVQDIGTGADGSIWATAKDDRVHKWDGTNWTLKSGSGINISVSPEGNPWLVNSAGNVWKVGPLVTAKTRTLFPRQQYSEYKMLKALGYGGYNSIVSNGGSGGTLYANLDDQAKAFGNLALTAAEIFYTGNSVVSGDDVLAQAGSFTDKKVRQSISGILGILVMNEISKSAPDMTTMALKNWATNLYWSIKVRSAKAMLDEYQKWKADWCTYEGISPEECRVKNQGIVSLFTTQKPPQELIGKNGLKSVLAGNADIIANGVALGLSTLSMASAGILLYSALGTVTWLSSSGTIASLMGLYTAFGGSAGAGAGSAAAAAGIGISGWAGVIAAPVAAALLCIVVGTIEGIAVVEAAKMEPTLKMKLGAAMSEPINISNMMADSSARNMFFIAFMEAAEKGFQITDPKINGEVRFYCQAGYVSAFRLSYTLNGQNQSFTTPDLSVGQEKSIPIPYNATNIKAEGWYALAGWKTLFNKTLDRPSFYCFTSYGTIVEPKYKTDCPEVGNMTTKANQLIVTQGGGYIARIKLSYEQNGKQITVLDQSDLSTGWRRTFDIPIGVINVRLQAWSATGLVWEPWKMIGDKIWPYPPNECVKVDGTTLDPKWKYECN